MATQRDRTYQFIPQSPAPMHVSSATTLDDVIAATILQDQPANEPKPVTSDPDLYLNNLLTSLLTDTPTQEQTTPTVTRTKAFTTTSPYPDNRFNNSLTGFSSPIPTNHHPVSSIELQSLLRSEIQKEAVPTSLLQTVQPSRTQIHTVHSRELQLQQRFQKLEYYYPFDIQQLSSFYRYQSALIETGRFQSLNQYMYYPSYHASLNSYYDNQLHQIMDRVECSIMAFEKNQSSTSQDDQIGEQPTRPSVLRTRPVLSKKAINIMETWYKENIHHPYPNHIIVQEMALQSGLREEQIKKWFGNKRNRSKNARPYNKKKKTATHVQYMI